jgi:TonB family protein
MTIQPDGAIGSVTVVESSSHSALDDAALEAVRGLRPMPFPAGVPRRELYVRVPVIFRLP